jgi:hypothetical protein
MEEKYPIFREPPIDKTLRACDMMGKRTELK